MSNFAITRGDTVEFSASITLGGVALNITGASLWFTAKKQFIDADEDAVFQKTIGDGITVTNAASGLITIAIDPEDTEELSNVKTQLQYDLQMKDSEDKVYTVASGTLVVNPGVTTATA